MNIDELLIEYESLPIGYISRKVIRGKECFYHQWKEDGKLKSRYLKAGELEPLQQQLAYRKELKALIDAENSRKEAALQNRIAAYAKRIFLGYKVPIGIQDYEYLIPHKCFYVDKTDFIRHWWQNDDQVTLITRPRRFGKTLNMSMVNCFFSLQYKDRSDLFEGFNIWQYESMHKLQGSYPVIFLSFGAVKADYADGIKEQIANQIHMALFSYYYLEKEGLMTPEEVINYHSYLENMTPEKAITAIPFLSQVLTRIYGRKVIILLDEYDTPVLEAWSCGIWTDCSNYIRNLFNSLFKANPYLERALLTGITRVSKESFFSDLNNMVVASATTNMYESFFGFTESEVAAALKAQNLNTMEQVKEWYNGFHFGQRTDMYNPWSIINYLRYHEFKPYWVHSSSNKLISDLFMSGNENKKYILEDLIKGQSFASAIYDEINLEEIAFKDDAAWSLLVASGYLKIADANSNTAALNGEASLVVTNKEISVLLVDMVNGWFKSVNGYNNFITAMLDDDVDYMNEYMSRICQHVFSYYDISENEPEKFYHGFVLGMLIDLEDEFIITSNRESGLGRYDVVLEPRNPDENHAIIIEFKVHRPRKEADLEATADAALKQIDAKNYSADLVARGIPMSNIYRYGIAFKGKEVLIK